MEVWPRVSEGARLLHGRRHCGAYRGAKLEGAYILKNILLEYGPIASWKLSQMSHKEQSWINARSGLGPEEVGNVPLSLEDIQRDAEKVRPYDHMWDMYYDEFEDLEAEEGG